MRAARSSLLACFAVLAAAACTSTAVSSGGPDAGYCASSGYEPAGSGGTCPKGTCAAKGTAEVCCGALCATCEDKGLVSYTSGGACPSGTCPSADVTATLACCDTVASSLPNGVYCKPAMADAVAPETGMAEAAVEASAPEASSD